MDVPQKQKRASRKRNNAALGIHPKEKRYVDLVVSRGDKTVYECYLEAGYTNNSTIEIGRINASKVLRKPHIKHYRDWLVKQIEQQTAEKLGITINWKLEKLKEVTEACLDGRARQNDASSIDAKGVISAIGEMNKMQGHYAPTESKLTHAIDDNQFDELCEQYKQDY